MQTENIFPIIKKFLYSDHEIFLRELVSNAVDASQKLKTLTSLGELQAETDNIKVEVILNPEERTLTIRDYGIGMTAEEVDKYINQIAFSGAEEFLNKYKDSEVKNAIIGHFGLGFYSAFMVASRVDIISLSHQDGATAVKWSCDGSPNYTLEEITKDVKGTDIVLHIAEDADEFLQEERISSILNKYCKFMPVPIIFGTRTEYLDDPSGETEEDGTAKQISQDVERIINNTEPAWSRKPADMNNDDYSAFYRELYPMTFEDPLFHIHLNVDYPFNLTGILFFPKLKQSMEVQKNKIHLYSNQVFITDNVENIVPDFLTLLHGVIDSPDIPLNVSRSYLQEDSNVKKISAHITKKVADKLNSMFNNDRLDFESKWESIRIFIEYGMLTDEKFFEKGLKFGLFKSTSGNFATLAELKDKLAINQKNKNGKTIVLYTADPELHHDRVQKATAMGYEVMMLDGPLAAHFISRVENHDSDLEFRRVDADTLEKLIEKDEATTSLLSDDQEKTLQPFVEEVAGTEKFTVSFAPMSSTEHPMVITQSEFMRRMKEQQAAGGGGFSMFGDFPEKYNLVVNSNHPAIERIAGLEDDDLRKNLLRQLTDLALLSNGMLKGEKLAKFVERSVNLV